MSSPYPSWGAIEASLAAPVYLYNGARKIVRNVYWSAGTLPEVDLKHLGYKKPETKMKALDRMYFNPLEADRIASLLHRRRDQAFSAVAMSMRAGAKDSRSMGWCLESIVFSVTDKGDIRATVMYRSTELIKKFVADLAWLPRVFERLDVRPASVDFFFANAYLSGVFFTTLFLYVDPIEFLERLRREEYALFIVGTRFLRRSVRDRDHRFPYSPERLQHELSWSRYPKTMKRIHTYLKENLPKEKQ